MSIKLQCVARRATTTEALERTMSNYPQVPPRLSRIFPNNPVYFVTFCTHRRKAVLANEGVDAAFREFAVRAYAEHNIAVGRYVIMPDHIHFFVRGPDDFNLGRWMACLKQALAKAIGCRSSAVTIWQRGFFDHLLRSDESYGQKLELHSRKSSPGRPEGVC
jgi:putative transposase